MENIYELFSVSDGCFLKEYLGSRPFFDVMRAYESAFGSVQILSYEWDALEAIVRDYSDADEETQRKFCGALEGQRVSPRASAASKTRRRIREREKAFRAGCRTKAGRSGYGIAESLRRQYGI